MLSATKHYRRSIIAHFFHIYAYFSFSIYIEEGWAVIIIIVIEVMALKQLLWVNAHKND